MSDTSPTISNITELKALHERTVEPSAPLAANREPDRLADTLRSRSAASRIESASNRSPDGGGWRKLQIGERFYEFALMRCSQWHRWSAEPPHVKVAIARMIISPFWLPDEERADLIVRADVLHRTATAE